MSSRSQVKIESEFGILMDGAAQFDCVVVDGRCGSGEVGSEVRGHASTLPREMIARNLLPLIYG